MEVVDAILRPVDSVGLLVKWLCFFSFYPNTDVAAVCEKILLCQIFRLQNCPFANGSVCKKIKNGGGDLGERV